MSLLEAIGSPADVRRLPVEELPKLAEELRERILETVAKTGGYLASNLGVVELTVALHHAFETPRDLLVWDVGHQTYAHKMLTARLDRMESLRSYGGLSGFLSRAESEYDVLEAGHASTSLSAALGLAVARDERGEDHQVVAVVGDGAMNAGMAFEAMNQAGHLGKRLIVILNDNSMSISPSVGAMTGYLDEIMAGRRYAKLKDDLKRLLGRVPKIGDQMVEVMHAVEEGVRQTFIPGTLFEELGFRYLGPVNGHSIPKLLEAFGEAKEIDGPVLIHTITQTGKGYRPAEEKPVAHHEAAPSPRAAGAAEPAAAGSWTASFSQSLLRLAELDRRVVAITASMPYGTGLSALAEKLPERCFNTGIAEQHSVTLAAGLALGGMKPVVAIYSTFLQRAVDQIFHDVCLMNLPVTFAVGQAGLAGADGPTHHGVFDIAFLRMLPRMVVMAPKDENELQHMLATALSLGGPAAVRYPRGVGTGVAHETAARPLPVGKAEVLRRGGDGSVWALGSMVPPTLAAAERLAKDGVELTVVNARFVKPLDRDALAAGVADHGRIATVEEHTLAGGFGSAVLEALSEMGLDGVETLTLGIPDRVVPHGSKEVLLRSLSLDAEGLYFRLRQFFSAAPMAKLRG